MTRINLENDPEFARYRDYVSVLGIVPEELLNETPKQKLVLRIVGGAAFRLDYTVILKRLLETRGIKPRGVVHLGGHRGEELLAYVGLGFSQIVFVEADPALHADLSAAIAIVDRTLQLADDFLGRSARPKMEAVNVAVSDHAGTATLFRTSFSPANSLFRPQSDEDWLQVEGSISVETTTVDQMLHNLGPRFSRADFNFMRLNIQGAELLALRGAKETLKTMDLVYAEVNFDDRYPGAPTAQELESFMAGEGFRPIERYRHKQRFEAIGDILFVRK